MTARTDEIETAMLAEFKAHDIEDTPANRHAFLEGLRDAWNEPEEGLDFMQAIEKTMYMLALEGMLFTLELQR